MNLLMLPPEFLWTNGCNCRLSPVERSTLNEIRNCDVMLETEINTGITYEIDILIWD